MLVFLVRRRNNMSDSEIEEMRNIFFDDKFHRRILELLDNGLKCEEIVDKLLEEAEFNDRV
jgi:hypothetical protein